MDRDWQRLSEEILTDIQEWQRAHPKATFREIEARLCTISSLADECSEPLLHRKELLKSLGKPAERENDGLAALFQRHLHQPDVEKVGGGEAPCIAYHTQTA